MDNKQLLSALAMDLKRVALGLYRKSDATAARFLIEAMKRKQEIDTQKLLPYMQQILTKVNEDINAEDALMYSTRIQNYVMST